MKPQKFIKINSKAVYESRLVVQGNDNPVSPSIAITRKVEHPLSRYSLNYSLRQSLSTSFSVFNSCRSNRERTMDRALCSNVLQLPKKALLLDLDETLIHSTQVRLAKTIPNYTLFISFDSLQPKQNIYVYARPYLAEFLEKIARRYELMIFTASQPSYANPIIDLIDPNRLIVSRFYRSHCRLVNCSLVKDISIVNRALNGVILVDNSPSSFFLQNDNGIPIPSWTGDGRDSELFKLGGLLEYLADVKDVRDYIRLFVENDQVNYAKFCAYSQKKRPELEQSKEQLSVSEYNSCSSIKEELDNTVKGVINGYSYLPFNSPINPSLKRYKKILLPFALLPQRNSPGQDMQRSEDASVVLKLPLMKTKSKSTSNLSNKEKCFLKETKGNDLPVLKRSISKMPTRKDLFYYKVRKYIDHKAIHS